MRGPHLHPPVDHAQIAAFDQFGTHLVSQKSVFEIGAVVDARRKHGDVGLALASRRRARSEAFCQLARIGGNGFDVHLRKQFGEHRHHRFAVFEHIAHPRRGSGVVFQHEPFIGTGADQIDPDDVGVDFARRRETDHLLKPCRIVAEQPRRNAACAQDFLPVVKIVDERVQRADPLFNPAGKAAPFVCADGARHHVERDQPFFGLVLAVNVEGDACLAKAAFSLAMLALQPALILLVKPFAVTRICRTNGSVGIKHLVKFGFRLSHEPPIQAGVALTLVEDSYRGLPNRQCAYRTPTKGSAAFKFP